MATGQSMHHGEVEKSAKSGQLWNVISCASKDHGLNTMGPLCFWQCFVLDGKYTGGGYLQMYFNKHLTMSVHIKFCETLGLL